MARLIVAMPSPVDVLSGDRNKPCDWREPMVTINNAAASRTMSQYERDSLRDGMVSFPLEGRASGATAPARAGYGDWRRNHGRDVLRERAGPGATVCARPHARVSRSMSGRGAVGARPRLMIRQPGPVRRAAAGCA